MTHSARPALPLSVADSAAILRHLAAGFEAAGIRFLVLGNVRLRRGPGLTATEGTLLARPGGSSGRLRWLRGMPPHLAALYAGLPGVSPACLREVFHPVRSIATGRGRLNLPHRSDFVTVVGGRRHTTGQPGVHDRSVFLLGDSGVFGFGCEDRHTLASQLQALLNAQPGPRSAVFNLGARGRGLAANLLALRHLGCRPGDAVVLAGIEDALMARLSGLGEARLRPDFSRRPPGQELFIDPGHVAHAGQGMLARQLLARLLAPPPPVQPAPPKDAGRLAAALGRLDAHGRACDALLARAAQGPAFAAFLDALPRPGTERPVGALVMNANPFTLGHRHLVEHAAGRVARLYVFVVQEDRSAFDFATRIALVRRGTADLPGVTVLPSGAFILSAATCPAYFTKEERPDVEIDATADLMLFAEHVAPRLGIGVRFVAEEPLCPVTRQHNAQMRAILPPLGIRVEEIPRLELEGTAAHLLAGL